MTDLTLYLEAKIKAHKIREQARSKGLDPDKVYPFEPDPIAEEALLVARELAREKARIEELRKEIWLKEQDVLAEKRNVTYLKGLMERNKELVPM